MRIFAVALALVLGPDSAQAGMEQARTEMVQAQAPKPPTAGQAGAAGQAQPAPKRARPARTDDEPVPEVRYGVNALPAPVRRIREQLIEAAKSGDVERLRPIFEANETPPIFSLADAPKDPVAFWKEQSGDGEGREVLAILLDILDAGYVHVDAGTAREMYIWPYFYRYPLGKLSPPQLVELFRIVTGYDFTEMQNYGGYMFYRIGIGPDGTWHFFVAGE